MSYIFTVEKSENVAKIQKRGKKIKLIILPPRNNPYLFLQKCP